MRRKGIFRKAKIVRGRLAAIDKGNSMKRKDAFRKVKIVCERLDATDENFAVIPKGLYLFGSLLTDKPEPRDIDLLCDYEEHDRPAEDAYAMMMQGKFPSRTARAAMGGRQKGVEIIMRVLREETADDWFRMKFDGIPVPYVCVWERGLDWRKVIENVQQHPLPYNQLAEAARLEFLDDLQAQLDATPEDERFDLDKNIEEQSLIWWRRVQGGEFGITPEIAELSWEGIKRVSVEATTD